MSDKEDDEMMVDAVPTGEKLASSQITSSTSETPKLESSLQKLYYECNTRSYNVEDLPELLSNIAAGDEL